MKWREIGPYLRELWQRPAGPMNWKNPIRVFAVLGWMVVQGFVLLGWAGWRRLSRSDAVGLDGVSRRPTRCTASGPAAVFFRRCVVRRLALCTPSLPVAGRASDPCFGPISYARFLHRHAVVVLPFTLRCRHAVRGYFRHRLEGLAGRTAARFRALRQAPAVAAFSGPTGSGYRHRGGPSSGRSAGDF